MTNFRVARSPSGELDAVVDDRNLFIQCPGPKTAVRIVAALEACHRLLAHERGEGGLYAAVAKAREAVGANQEKQDGGA